MNDENNIVLFGIKYPVDRLNCISDHGVPYTERKFSIPVAEGEIDFSIRVYPKNTFVVIEYWDNRRDGPDLNDIAGPLVRTSKTPNGTMTLATIERYVLGFGEPTGEVVNQ